MVSLLKEDNINNMLHNSYKNYFNTYTYDKKEYCIINNEKENPLINIDEEEMLNQEGPSQDLLNSEVFLPNINQIFEESNELPPIIFRDSSTKNLKDLELPFNPENNDLKNEKNENIPPNIENQPINENNEKSIEKENIINDNIKNENMDCIKEEKLFNISNLNLFSPSCNPDIRYIINDNINKMPKPKRDNKFSFKKPFKISNKDKPKVRKKRKDKPDSIRKKIKGKLLKSTIKCINKKLKNANSKKQFVLFPHSFISNITKKGNDKSILNMTFKELISTDFSERYKKKSSTKENNNKNMLKRKRKLDCSDNNQDKNPDKKKYIKNLKILKYLEEENNKNIREKINFESIEKMTFIDLLNEYLKSAEFEEDIKILQKKEKSEYINDYIIKAFNYINHFSQ